MSDISQVIQNIWQFVNDNPDTAGIVVTVIFAVLGTSWAAIRWGVPKLWQAVRPKLPASLPDPNFPFAVIKPHHPNPLKPLMGSEQDNTDRLADFNIPYQSRLGDGSVRREIEQRLQTHRWLLILGQTGLGKTREAAELAKILNNEGWTILKLKNHELLSLPSTFPAETIGTQPKILFFLDNVNQAMYLSQPRIPMAAQTASADPLLKTPLQERLLHTLSYYEGACGPDRVRVIATARNETASEKPGVPSPREMLGLEQYPKFWDQFNHYNLPEPDNEAIVSVLEETVLRSGVAAKEDDYETIARRNDCTFRNVIENLVTARNRNQTLTQITFRSSLRGTWEQRYNDAVKKFPAARHVYDAVDLLQAVNVDLYDFTVAPTARLIAGGNWLKRLQNRWLIHQALDYLIKVERILEPRDGQIEAKGKSIEVGEYLPKLSRILLKLPHASLTQIPSSLARFAAFAYTLNFYKETIASIDTLLRFETESELSGALFVVRGSALSDLGRKEDAIASYDQAIAINADDYVVWCFRGNELSALGRKEDAIASYDQAIAIKADFHKAWGNRGNALSALGRNEDAIKSYDQAIAINADDPLAWYNRGNALYYLGRNEEAIASYDQAIAIKADYYNAWGAKGLALQTLQRFEEAISSYDRAIDIQPDDYRAWYAKARCYALWGKADDAIDSLRHAIELDAACREKAKTDSDFDAIRDDARFKALIGE
ncbi:MAG: tetratricopeptide repeat protein [Elainellaceae cyanobacterium]